MHSQVTNVEVSSSAVKPIRSGASVNVYLILRKGEEVLLHLRKNTGYCDGYYGLVSGHVEDGESAKEAMIREAKEEIGIEIDPGSIRVVHVMHRKTNRSNIDFFFECYKWRGDPVNQEPEKCASIDYFLINLLPCNTISYVKAALLAASSHTFYSEDGWQ